MASFSAEVLDGSISDIGLPKKLLIIYRCVKSTLNMNVNTIE